jgi:hypothetical protein
MGILSSWSGDVEGAQNSEDDRDWSFEFWFLKVFGSPEKGHWPFWVLLQGCARPPCTIVYYSAGDLERAKLD